jgi:hypothetical protein
LQRFFIKNVVNPEEFVNDSNPFALLNMAGFSIIHVFTVLPAPAKYTV